VSHPRRSEELVGDANLDGHVTIRLVNHHDTDMQIKHIRSACIGASPRTL